MRFVSFVAIVSVRPPLPRCSVLNRVLRSLRYLPAEIFQNGREPGFASGETLVAVNETCKRLLMCVRRRRVLAHRNLILEQG